MPRYVSDHAVATVEMLLVDYYTSGRRRHTYESIARRAGVSRATVARIAARVRRVIPTTADLEARIGALESRVADLEAALGPAKRLEGVA